MKVITLVVSFISIAAIGYLGLDTINAHIDCESGAVVEETLSNNTITQLKLLSDVQLLLESGDIAQANAKLSESAETLVYILEHNCDLPKCEEALRRYTRM